MPQMMPQSVQECWASSEEKDENRFGSFEGNDYLCTRWWVIETAGGSASGVHWMHFIAECGIEYGFQFVTQFFLNLPDCLYTKKSWEFLQSYKKTSGEQNKFICFFFRVPSKFATKWQSYEKSSAEQNKFITILPDGLGSYLPSKF